MFLEGGRNDSALEQFRFLVAHVGVDYGGLSLVSGMLSTDIAGFASSFSALLFGTLAITVLLFYEYARLIVTRNFGFCETLAFISGVSRGFILF